MAFSRRAAFPCRRLNCVWHSAVGRHSHAAAPSIVGKGLPTYFCCGLVSKRKSGCGTCMSFGAPRLDLSQCLGKGISDSPLSQRLQHPSSSSESKYETDRVQRAITAREPWVAFQPRLSRHAAQGEEYSAGTLKTAKALPQRIRFNTPLRGTPRTRRNKK